jgi:hypothetical protein
MAFPFDVTIRLGHMKYTEMIANAIDHGTKIFSLTKLGIGIE